MYAGPSKRVATKAVCPSRWFFAPCRPLSSSAVLAAKRSRQPEHVSRARARSPGSVRVSEDGTRTSVAARLGPHLITMEFANDLQSLGFHKYRISNVVDALRLLAHEASKLHVNTAFTAISTQKRYISMMEASLGYDEALLMSDPRVLRKALHLLGKSYFHLQNRKGRQGVVILRMVFLGGEIDAGIDAAAGEVLTGHQTAREQRYVIPGALHTPQIYEYLKAKALSRSDWRAMTLYLDEMSRAPATEAMARDHYKMAKELYQMLEPSEKYALENQQQLTGFLPPWNILFDAAKKYISFLPKGAEQDQVQKDIETALHNGIHKYSDPKAIPPALREPNVIPRYSPAWMELAHQSAAGGDKDSALELAKYHLREGGWLEQPGTKNKPIDWTGIEWLGVSAALSAPDTPAMVNKYLGLAHLLWAHGHRVEAWSWMERAKENVTEAGLDPVVRGRHEWEAKFAEYEQSWRAAEKDKELSDKFWRHGEECLAPFLEG